METAAPKAAAWALLELVRALAVACGRQSMWCQTGGAEIAKPSSRLCAYVVGCSEASSVGPAPAVCGCPGQHALFLSSEPKPPLCSPPCSSTGGGMVAVCTSAANGHTIMMVYIKPEAKHQACTWCAVQPLPRNAASSGWLLCCSHGQLQSNCWPEEPHPC